MSGGSNPRPAGAYALALSLLPGVGPVSLLHLLARGDPETAWADVLSGRARRPAAQTAGLRREREEWDAAARRIDIPGSWARTRQAGIGVTWLGSGDYPEALRADPAPPAVLFWRGSLEALSGPCVALVGTRHATADGRASAFEMGRDLAEAGVCVVSGLALGIDGSAHRGALGTRRPGATVGVAASGVDRPYPIRHRELWQEVVGLGAVLSETPPGWPAQRWRFPARNRIIAGLVSMVVVVESHAAGGSLITADAAIERGIEVRAVPGPIRSPASAGTNQLLYDGPGPVRDATDVLIALGTAVGRGSAGSSRQAGDGPPRPPPARPDADHRLPGSVPPPTGSVPPPPGSVPLTGSVPPPPTHARPDADRRFPGSVPVHPGALPASASARSQEDPLPAAAMTPAPTDHSAPSRRSSVGSGRDGRGSDVLEAMGWRPRSLNWIAEHCDHDVAVVTVTLAEMVAAGQVAEERGWWQRLS